MKFSLNYNTDHLYTNNTVIGSTWPHNAHAHGLFCENFCEIFSRSAFHQYSEHGSSFSRSMLGVDVELEQIPNLSERANKLWVMSKQ